MQASLQSLLSEATKQISEFEKKKSALDRERTDFERYKEKEMERLRKKLEQDYQAKDESLKQRESRLVEQENFIRNMQLKNSKIIKLNVGGTKFNTTLTTLTSKPESMLAAMFSGRHDLLQDDEGFYFIDRNGNYFSYILDYLRTGEFPSTLSREALNDVKKEAAYYQIISDQKPNQPKKSVFAHKDSNSSYEEKLSPSFAKRWNLKLDDD